MGHHGFDIRDDTARSGNLAERSFLHTFGEANVAELRVNFQKSL